MPKLDLDATQKRTDGWRRLGPASLKLCDIIDALIAECRELREDNSVLLDEAFRQIAAYDAVGKSAGWWDSMGLSTACDLGDKLVEFGLWERHPDGHGRRWFYRPKKDDKAREQSR